MSIARNPAVDAAIATIGDEQYQPVRYPGAVLDPDNGQLISDAQVAEVQYTAFADSRYRITGRLVVRRVVDANWSDLIDGPWAHQPSGIFAANAAWCILAAICHNLLRAAATLTGTTRYAAARGATLRTHLVNVPARLARPQRRPVLHLPTRWPRARAWRTLWTAVFTT